MSKDKRKLQLKRETVRTLTGDALTQVAGGGGVFGTVSFTCTTTGTPPLTTAQSVCHVQLTPPISIGPPIEEPQPQPWKAG